MINFSTGALEMGCVLMVNGGGLYKMSNWVVSDDETAGSLNGGLLGLCSSDRAS
jgi:hypothetical protein